MRRWYVLLPLLALTGLGAVSAGNSVAPEYQATATIMYVAGPGETELPNPYGDLSGANEVATIVLNSVETRTALAAAGHGGAYEVTPQSRSSIAYLSIRSGDPEDAVATGTALIDVAAAELVSRQEAAGIPPTAQVGLQVLEPPTVIAAVQEGKLRVQAVVGVLGAGVSLLVAVLFDDIIGLWKRARARGLGGERKRARGEKRRESAADAEAETAGTGPAEPDAETEAAPPAELPRRKAEPATTNGAPPDDDHGGLGTASPSINSALINTNEWVWPGDHSLEEAIEHEQRERPQRNPFFDPEFTKRQLRKSKREQDAGTDAEPAEPETSRKR
ncbi:hypothetical protein [Jiangella alba]|uniref:hypothetical protein n=1 Tax=Jiangella alba TaxID=561176 RepID=UPI00083F125C|nr:hypothetical protein [Jiangella alba]